ncbi:MAG: hypothetical protein NT091_03540, partial [Candidatus Falkowbacteria bacterium]|nr:hypothetical protein [Candidatus Falkowbacteria bacterium]
MQRTYFKREIINAPGFQSDNDEVLTFKGSTEDKSRGADNLAFVPEKIDNLSKKALFRGLELIYDPKTNLFYIDSDNIGTSFKGLEEYVESIQIVTQFTKAYGRESGLYKL